MRRIAVSALAAAMLPSVAHATSSRDRGFAVCLTITPGLGAASLGHPLRGGLNFGLYAAGGGVLASGIANDDSTAKTAGAGMLALSVIWAFADGVSLEAASEAPRAPVRFEPAAVAPMGAPVVDAPPVTSPEALTVGQRVRVTKKDGATLQGTVTSTTDEEVTLAITGGLSLKIRRDEIQQVRAAE